MVKIVRMSKGEYWYKNGITIKREGNKWIVRWGCGDIAYTAKTLQACKDFVYDSRP